MKGILLKLENIFLFLFILFIPTQLGKHFWPSWSLVMGVRVDYLSPVLYLVDIFWSLWVLLKIINLKYKVVGLKNDILSFQNILIFIFVVVNFLVAGNKWVAIYRWLRIGQWVATYKLLKNLKMGGHIGPPVQKILGRVLPWWIGLESLLGLAQVVKGGSLQGVFYWLGERNFDFGTIGIAQMSIVGNGLTRAYGTFSHPNSLAGFLLVALVWWGKYKRNLVWWVVFWLGVVGIVICGSRVVWGLSVVALIYSLKFKVNKQTIGYGLVLLGMVVIVLGMVGVNYRVADFVGGWDSDSLSKRVNLNMVGMKMWRDSFGLGVGAGNFISELPSYQSQNRFYWLQPIHNIFLLAGVETGMLGVLIIIKLLIFDYKVSKKKDLLIIGIIVVTGMMDHYWITLPQNSWLLCMVMVALGQTRRSAHT